MSDEDTNEKKRKSNSKWKYAYSKMSIREVEKRLGFRMHELKAISVDRILANKTYSTEGVDSDTISKTKDKVYEQILGYLEIECYPSEADANFKESNMNDLVYATISPILIDFKHTMGRNSIQLLREKEIIATDSQTGGKEEFIVIDFISVMEEKFVLVVEAKRSSLGQAMRQCLMVMKDTRDNNGGGVIYGFVTTGESWQMLSYDGKDFCLSRKIHSVFGGMDEDKELWLKDFSGVVDCMFFALSNGGIVKQDVVVQG